ncbi:hypothetical protein ACU4GH_01075 [Bradyrhizobium betae]
MDEQEDRVIPVLTADLNPLLDAADLDELSLLHTRRRTDRQSLGSKALAIGTENPVPQRATTTRTPTNPSNEIPIRLAALRGISCLWTGLGDPGSPRRQICR